MLAERHNVRAHFWQSLANYTQQIGAMALGIILARLLSPNDFGTFAFCTATVSLVMLPANWSLTLSVVAEGANEPSLIGDAWRLAEKTTLARLVLLGAGCYWLNSSHGWSFAMIGLICGLPLAISEYIAVMRAALEATHQFKINFYDAILTLGVTALVGIPAAIAGSGVWSLVLPAIPLYCLQFLLFRHYSKIATRPASSQRRHMKTAGMLWVASLSEQALLRIDKFFVGQFTGEIQVGNYNRAYNYAPFGVRILNSLVTNPTITALNRAPNAKAKMRLLGRMSLLLLVAGAANFAVLWWFSDPLVPWVFGPQWREAIPVFKAFAPLSLVIAMAYLPTTVLLARRGYLELGITRALALVLFCVGAFVAGSRFDATMAAWLFQAALVLQGCTLCIILVFQARQKQRPREGFE